MLICVDCKREMKCYKTGLGARWGEFHIYAGDAFECLDCGVKIIKTNPYPSHDPEQKVETIQMKNIQAMTLNDEDVQPDDDPNETFPPEPPKEI